MWVRRLVVVDLDEQLQNSVRARFSRRGRDRIGASLRTLGEPGKNGLPCKE
jgi:hypothetical protein